PRRAPLRSSADETSSTYLSCPDFPFPLQVSSTTIEPGVKDWSLETGLDRGCIGLSATLAAGFVRAVSTTLPLWRLSSACGPGSPPLWRLGSFAQFCVVGILAAESGTC